MQVTLLGPVAAEACGELLPLGGRKQRCVFALLALNVNRTVSLDRLVHEIWRDEPPARATLALQAYISRLRKVLAAVPDGQAGRIVTRRPGWVLEVPAQHVDAVRFRTLVADGQAQVSAGRAAEGAALLRTALGLWSGEPLADLDDAAFAIEDAARLTEARLDATEALFEANLAVGADSSVAAAARNFVADNPFRERAWCSLVLALYRSGRQAEAFSEIRRLRHLLADGLGLDPSPAAQRLETMMLNHDPALRGPPFVATPGPSAAIVDEASNAAPAGPSDHVVGRRPELAAIVSAVHAAHHGDGRLIVVEGPAGMGKSTILRCLEGSVHAIDGLVLRGAGGGVGPRPALWPWITIVRQLRVAIPNLATAESRGPAADALALLDPSLGDPAPAAQADPQLARTRLYRAVIDLLAASRSHRPVAVVIDDAHWLDRESLDLLALAVDELIPIGVLVCVALRPEESVEILDWVGGLAARTPGKVMRLPLAGLNSEEVAVLVAGVTGSQQGGDVLAAVAVRTGGNPFFVVELVQLLMSERRVDLDGVYAFLPAGVRDVLRRRLDRLPEQTLALLAVFALLGRGAGLELLSAVTGMDDDAALDGCEAALLTGLLIEDALSGGFELSHDLVRQSLVEALSAARAVRLHARIGEALQAGGGPYPPERVVEIAHHLTQAAPIVGAAAVPFLLTAADDAFTRLASRRAGEYLATALKLTATQPVSVHRTASEAQIRGRLMTGLLIVPGGEDAATLPVLTAPESVAPLDPEAPAAWWSAVLLLIACGENADAEAACQDAWREDLLPGAAATVQFAFGLACLELGRLDDADAHLARSETPVAAVQEQTATGAFSFAATATVLRACVAALRGDHVRARALVRRAKSAPDESLVQSVTIDFWSAWCAVQEGDPPQVDDLARVCIERAVGLGDSFYATTCRLFRGWASAMRGDPDGVAVADAAYADYAARFAGLRFQGTVQLALRAEAYAHHHQPDRARELMCEAGELAALTGEHTLGVRLTALSDHLSRA